MTILHDHKALKASNRTVLLHQHATAATVTFATAYFDKNGVTISQMSNEIEYIDGQKTRPQRAIVTELTQDELTALIEQYQQFQADILAQQMAESKRQAGVWLEVESLKHTIPGLSITRRENDEHWDESEERYVTGPAWTVEQMAISYQNKYCYSADDVLKRVQEAIEAYNNTLADCKKKWKLPIYYSYPTTSPAVVGCQEFLATHHAFVAGEPLPDQQPVANTL